MLLGGPGCLTIHPSDFLVTINSQKICIFCCPKKHQITGPQIRYFFGQFCRFLVAPASILGYFGHQKCPRRLILRRFSENGDFVKIELPLWREHDFEGSHPLKIDPESAFAWQRHRKMMESASDANSGRFWCPGYDFSRFQRSGPDQKSIQKGRGTLAKTGL